MGLPETQNLTVVLRVRPPNEPHVGKDRIVHVLDGQMVILTDPRDEDDILRAKRSREKRYMFDIAFDSYNTQLDVYLATTKPLISSVLEGFNATVFAYGPTGTGKTYTMLGTGDNPGIMALALNEIFALVRRGSENSTYTVCMSYLEVYNELIRDLLSPESGDLELREDNSAGVTVAGLTEVEAQSTREVMDMLRDGNKRRTTEPTSVNKTSSRSHAVLQVTVKKLGRARSLTETISTGKLYMIDLAGSERATHTKNRGTRLVEGAHINRSLLALGNCIKALSNNSSSYVNYRDSKLTRLLKDSLGGNCRTVMIAHVSPDQHVFDESRNTLQYADRAKRIKTKIRPNLQTVSHHIAKYPIIVEELHKEIARLKQINDKGCDSQSLESESGIIPVKVRDLLESKKSELDRAFTKQLKNKERLCRLETQHRLASHKSGHLQSLLNQHRDTRSLYTVLPPIPPSPTTPGISPRDPTVSSQIDIEAKEIDLKTALRRQSARRRRGENSKERLKRTTVRLAEKYRSIEEDIEDKILDTDHREILALVSNVHALELQLTGSREQVTCLSSIAEEQANWLDQHVQYNTGLLEVVRTQHELLSANHVQITPQLQQLYQRLHERGLAEYSVLPRIGSANSTLTDEEEEEEESGDEVSSPSTPPGSDHTPVFTKTYNVVGKDGEGGVAGMIAKLEEREPSQTTIHVLSTPSLTERDTTIVVERNRTVVIPQKPEPDHPEPDHPELNHPEPEISCKAGTQPNPEPALQSSTQTTLKPEDSPKVLVPSKPTTPKKPGARKPAAHRKLLVATKPLSPPKVELKPVVSKKVDKGVKKKTASKNTTLKKELSKESLLPKDTMDETTADVVLPKKMSKSSSLTGTWKALKNLVRSRGSADSKNGGRESPVNATPQITGISPHAGAMSRGGITPRGGITQDGGKSELVPVPSHSGSSPAPGKQAKKAIQLQRLRTLKTEPVLTNSPKQKPRGKNLAKANNKTALNKSDTHLKIAEKARIYGAPGNSRTPQTRGRKHGPRKGNTTSQLSINGSNKHFTMKVFR